ncbi:protein of unknown function (plasmid) [Cupriavidus taiwanensis]|uniref:Uncharacterized protein n=1 Tax=Cupriavidus taiwanensis TaxID=164546 RepID=A0A9Q7V1L5_9BURK|nr:protein of unknown function [Cupriavidus taiwanensis]
MMPLRRLEPGGVRALQPRLPHGAAEQARPTVRRAACTLARVHSDPEVTPRLVAHVVCPLTGTTTQGVDYSIFAERRQTSASSQM